MHASGQGMLQSTSRISVRFKGLVKLKTIVRILKTKLNHLLPKQPPQTKEHKWSQITLAS